MKDVLHCILRFSIMLFYFFFRVIFGSQPTGWESVHNLVVLTQNNFWEKRSKKLMLAVNPSVQFSHKPSKRDLSLTAVRPRMEPVAPAGDEQ